MTTRTTAPCKLCGGSEVVIRERDYWTGQRSKVISATLTHGCERKVIIRIEGRNEEEVLNKWKEVMW